MRKYADDNNGYKYILNVIDTFSKFVWSKPLKYKTGKSVAKAFESLLHNRKPKLLHVDKGLEFVNKDFIKILDKYNIKMYHTENEEKSTIIERFNGTLNRKMKPYFTANNNFKWINILDTLIKEYNYKDYHRTIKMKPFEVNKDNEKYILNTVYSPNRDRFYEKPKFKISDKVRITKFKSTFANKYETNWTNEIFKIHKILYTNPITYKLKDLNGEEVIGGFYNKELQKCKIC